MAYIKDSHNTGSSAVYPPKRPQSPTNAGGYTSSDVALYPTQPQSSTLQPNAMDSITRRLEQALRAQQDAQARQLQASINQGVQKLEGTRTGIEDRYQDGAQEAYVMSMMSKKNLPELLAVNGRNGGLHESTLADIDNNYMNGYNGLRRTYNDSMAGVDRDIAQLRASGDISLAENTGRFEQQIEEALRDARTSNQQYTEKLANQASSPQKERTLTLEQAMSMMKNGYSGNAINDTLNQWGVTPPDKSNTISDSALSNDDYAASLRAPTVQKWLATLDNNERIRPPVNQQDRDAQRAFALQSAYNQGMLRDDEFRAIAQKLGIAVQ